MTICRGMQQNSQRVLRSRTEADQAVMVGRLPVTVILQEVRQIRAEQILNQMCGSLEGRMLEAGVMGSDRSLQAARLCSEINSSICCADND